MRVFLVFLVFYSYILSNAHIFVYHRFGDIEHKSTNTSLSELKKEFEYFKQNGYKVVKLSKIVEYLNSKKEIPKNWIALSIDDSYKSFYENGLALFKEYNYPFTIYVYVEATQKQYHDFMNWEQLKEVSKYGDLGLHSYAHPHLTKLTNKEIIKDTQKSISIFQKNLGYKPKSYVYPYGEFDSRVQNLIKRFDFDFICNQNGGAIVKNSNKYDLDRIALVGDVVLENKLKIKALDAQWQDIKIKDNILKYIKIKIPSNIKKIQLYISGYGWEILKVNNGIINKVINKQLKFKRNRIIIKTYNCEHSTRLIVN